MPTQTDRLTGYGGNVGIKLAARVATTTNLTLSGEQTIDGVACVTADRVLVKDQTTGAENGIYVVDTGAWSRSKDFNGAFDVVRGSVVLVLDGTANQGFWQLETSDPVTIGTTALVFGRSLENNAANISFLQSGSGAVTRSVQARLRDLVSVLDFIPVAEHAAIAAQTSTTDLTTYIQAALDAVHTDKRGGLYCPAGLYNTGEIDWPGNGIALLGAGSGYAYNSNATPRTIFKAKAGTTNVFDLVQTGTSEDRTNNTMSGFLVDGNAIATNGIKVAGANLLQNISAKGCTGAGILLSNFTNSTHLTEVCCYLNTGYGLKAEGVSATKFSSRGSNYALNTLGGVRLETGFVVSFDDDTFESNGFFNFSIYRPDTHTNLLGNFHFKSCWFEDPDTVDLSIDAQTRNHANAPHKIKFDNCHFSVPAVGQDYADLLCCKVVTFDHCDFNGSTQTDAINVNSTAFQVGIVESMYGRPGSVNGLTAAQVNNVIANGVACYVSDSQVPAVRAQRTGTNQSFTASTFTAVVYNSEILADTWAAYDSTTGVFTPTVAGDYLVSAQVGVSGDTAATRVLLSIYKNGTEFVRLSDVTATDIDGVNGTFIVPMDNDDTLDVRIWSNATNPVVLNGTPNSILNIKKIGDRG